MCQIEQARLVQQYCDKADTCLAKQDYRTVSNRRIVLAFVLLLVRVQKNPFFRGFIGFSDFLFERAVWKAVGNLL